MNNKALQEKLQKFIGIEYRKYEIRFGGNSVPCSGFYLNGKFIGKTTPDLVNSLDAQSKWIIPKLLEMGCEIKKHNCIDFKKWWVLIRYRVYGDFDYYCCVNNLLESLALALAVEKLIDSLEKNRNNE